jgi:hypothetical protein
LAWTLESYKDSVIEESSQNWEHLTVCGMGARDLTQRNMVVTQMLMHFLELGSPWESHP